MNYGCYGRNSGFRDVPLRFEHQQPEDGNVLRLNAALFSCIIGCMSLELLANNQPIFTSSHFARRGLSLHMFLNERLRASNLEIVVCEKSLP